MHARQHLSNVAEVQQVAFDDFGSQAFQRCGAVVLTPNLSTHRKAALDQQLHGRCSGSTGGPGHEDLLVWHGVAHCNHLLHFLLTNDSVSKM